MQYTLLIILIITVLIYVSKSFKKDTAATKVLSNDKSITAVSISSKLINTIIYFVFNHSTLLRGKLNTTTH